MTTGEHAAPAAAAFPPLAAAPALRPTVLGRPAPPRPRDQCGEDDGDGGGPGAFWAALRGALEGSAGR